ncbi:MAG: GGDEF domain-containing protein [Rhodospirillales bacterium]|nr:GGDEF domain-containing protein [Rhodospirillales bacterium]
MTQQDEYQQKSRVLSRQTLALIHKLGVSASPVNFSVFYAYLEKSNDGLVTAIDILHSNKRVFDDVQCHELYQCYVQQPREQEIIETLSAEWRDQVVQIFDQFAKDHQHHHLADLEKALQAVLGIPDHHADVDVNLEDRLDETSSEVSRLRDDLEKMKREALTDGLTGIANRKAFDEKLRDAAMTTMENGQELSLILVDIDFFKRLNDRFGHQAGDQIIRLMAKTLQQSVKGRDTTARYGGEEFAIILPATKLEDAQRLAENIRRTVETLDVVSENRSEAMGTITVSIGVACFQLGEPLARMIERADQALYLAKSHGRNLIMTENDLLVRPVESAAKA